MGASRYRSEHLRQPDRGLFFFFCAGSYCCCLVLLRQPDSGFFFLFFFFTALVHLSNDGVKTFICNSFFFFLKKIILQRPDQFQFFTSPSSFPPPSSPYLSPQPFCFVLTKNFYCYLDCNSSVVPHKVSLHRRPKKKKKKKKKDCLF